MKSQVPILEIRNLKTSFFMENNTEIHAVDDLSYTIHKGECVAIIGESGSGKTVGALSLLRLIPFPPGAILNGEILFHGEDILKMNDEQLKAIRGSRISMIFQEPGTALNPVLTIGAQIAETLIFHGKMTKAQAWARAGELLESIDIPNARERLRQYPHQFSGGMQQRAMIAMAMALNPDILIADEPTTALDVTVQAQVLDQLERMRAGTDAALVIITHNLGVVARYADSVKIMYGGRIVEEGSPYDIFENPHHPYTLGLIRAVPRLDLPRKHGLHPIEGEPVDLAKLRENCCAFAPRCTYATSRCEKERPVLTEIEPGHCCACFHMDETETERNALPKAIEVKEKQASEPTPPEHYFNPELPIDPHLSDHIDKRIRAQAPVPEIFSDNMLVVRDLKKYFPVTKGLLNRTVAWVKAVDGVDFSIRKGETLGIVGESGSGKSTIGHCVIRDYKATDGGVFFNNVDLSTLSNLELRRLRKQIQLITQDPFSSLDPRMTVEQAILEGAHAHGIAKDKKEGIALVGQMLEMVGLNPLFASRFPHEFSGGQRQRISIARALALNPSFIVCDEVVSALDVSIQSQIIALLMQLQTELGLTYIFIGHDLSVIRYISNRIAVMYLGKIVEMTDSDDLYEDPMHPYTQALISAVPIPNPTVDRKRERILLKGEAPSPIDTPKGCNFCTRCRACLPICTEEEPTLTDVGGGHLVSCHLISGKGVSTR